MSFLFNEILYKPLFNGLVLIYQTVAFNDFGVAIIIFTILLRIILYPLFHKMTVHQKLTYEMQPHLKKIQEKHKDNKEEQTKAILDLYKSYNTNPLTPLLLILIQLPIFIALYQVFSSKFTAESFNILYSFVPHITEVNFISLGFINLHEPNILIVLLAAAAQYFQAKLSLPERKAGEAMDQTEKMSKMMIYMGPVFTIMIFSSFPAALPLYWLTFTIFSIMQQIIVNKSFKNGGTTK
jgi:YidC/Oxa1 family membrane protein insertase